MSSYYEHKSAKIFDFIVNNYHKYDNFIGFMSAKFEYNSGNSQVLTKHNHRKHYWLYYGDQFVTVMTAHMLAILVPSSNTRIFSRRCDVEYNAIFIRQPGYNITFKAPEHQLEALAELAPIFLRADILPNTLRRVIRSFSYDGMIVRRGKQVLVIREGYHSIYDDNEEIKIFDDRVYMTLYVNLDNNKSLPIWEVRISVHGIAAVCNGKCSAYIDKSNVLATYTKAQLIEKYAR